MEVGKDTWRCVGACAELFSMRCHRNGLMQLICCGGVQLNRCVMDGWLLRSQITDTYRALLLFSPPMLSTAGKKYFSVVL